jgi:hypothetical protein
MPLTVRNVIEQLYRYLGREQRDIPFVPEDHPDLQDPLPEALVAVNGALQQMAGTSPLFAARQWRSAFFHAPVTIAVSGLTKGAKTMPEPAAWADWMTGCRVQMPGDAEPNRLLASDGENVALQFPHGSDETAGDAIVTADAAALDGDVLQVLPGVRSRAGAPLIPAQGRADLRRRRAFATDYGRSRSGECEAKGAIAYAIDSITAPASAAPRLMMLLHQAPESDFTVEFEARTSLGRYTAEDVTGDGHAAVFIPVPAQFVESIFLPLALWRFFGSSVMRNADVPRYIEQQAATAEKLLQCLRPQTDRKAFLKPTW